MGDFRARDADRERYVDVIEAAYVDGQLGDADRELRISRALTAETLDELVVLTRDLQNRPVPVVATQAPAPRSPARPAASAYSRSLRTLAGIVGAVLVGVVFIGAASSMQGTEDDLATGVSVPTPWVEAADGVTTPGFAMRAGHVRELVRAYQARFGSLEPYEVTFYPRRVQVQVPVAGNRPRFELWSWDGTWTKDAAPVVLDPSHERVDLGGLDPDRLLDNIRTARGALRVEEARFSRAVLSRSGDDPAVVTIQVTNQFHETGHLTATPAGEILGREPYAR